ncbi:peroxidasin homolog [Lineus longissimus]|uniref:peroxidasin homolog n=1 Tax=Lineus longissimus TaxID=88925 RepID=UPI002B4C9DB1
MWLYILLVVSVWAVSSHGKTYFEEHATVRGKQGKTVTLPCQARQNPENFEGGKVTWTKDGKDFSSDGRFKILPGNQLRIDNVKKEDAGDYQCQITVGEEQTSEHSILRVKGEPSVPVDVKVDCTTKADEHIAILTWDINPVDFNAKNRLTRYKIRVINTLNPTARQTQFQDADYASRRLIKLAPGAPYRFEVMALNEEGPSPAAQTTDTCQF